MFYAFHDHCDSTIQALVECFPQCLAMPTDAKARLPLKLKIITYFIEKYPDAVQVHDNKSKLPLHHQNG